MSYTPRNQMLYSTTYNLNSSFTKQIIAGAVFRKDDKLTSTMQLLRRVILEQAYLSVRKSGNYSNATSI